MQTSIVVGYVTKGARDGFCYFTPTFRALSGDLTKIALEDAIAAVMTSSFPMDLMDYANMVDNKGVINMGPDRQTGAALNSEISGFIILTNAKYSDLDESMGGYAPTAYSIIEGGATGEWVISNTGNTYTFTFTSAEQGDWKSVPEPTSGLLLLLGVAGLALRRRRA